MHVSCTFGVAHIIYYISETATNTMIGVHTVNSLDNLILLMTVMLFTQTN